MEVQGKIKLIREPQSFGTSNFTKREFVVTTSEQYPQDIQMEMVQDKCPLLNKFKVGEDVTVSINLRGREWINPEGKAVYFNTIQGWRIEKLEVTDIPPAAPLADLNPNNNDDDDLPF